ncbi:MAG: 16S rRNA (guanine(966)-N(2))-methyltransferase RsmD [Elusimicrobia bacterium]|nr:16S rRNA (guanine(966)-N(2))-methyltransferase RsmD [Elusimicrobiota bacterium]
MKIILGEYSGRNFYMPVGIRPTQNLLRKAVFDIIGHDLSGRSFLDLYAGSGAVGLEALSLGAREVVFVEHDPRRAQVIEENLEIFRPVERGLSSTVINQDSFKTIKQFARAKRTFDVVFFDPPFDIRLGKKTLKTLIAHDILHANSFVVAQVGLDEKMPEPDARWVLLKDKVYGASRLNVYRKM